MLSRFFFAVLLVGAGSFSPSVFGQLPEQADPELLFASDGANWDRFGIAVAVDGDVAVVGAYAADEVSPGGGAAYVFRRVGGVWTEEQKLAPADLGFDDRFGFYVAIHDDVVAVTASNEGAVYLFRFDGVSWLQEQKIVNPGAAFGSALSLDEDTLVIGDFLYAFTQGGAYVYQYNGTTWGQTQLLSPSGTQLYGISLDLDGDTLVVGASGENSGVGAAYVYVQAGGSFTLEQELMASDPQVFTGFGATVALDATALAVASLGANGDAGAVYLFQYDGSDWIEEQKLSLTEPAPEGGLGLVLDLDEPHLVAGAYGGIGCDEATQTYIFTKADNEWTEARQLVAPSSELANTMSRTVSIVGDEVWVGASCAGPGDPGPGGVYVYDLNPSFRRGDCNQDELIDITDVIQALAHLFQFVDAVECFDACDINDDGEFDVADPAALILFLFAGGAPLPDPGLTCGEDPTVDVLFCRSLPSCP